MFLFVPNAQLIGNILMVLSKQVKVEVKYTKAVRSQFKVSVEYVRVIFE